MGLKQGFIQIMVIAIVGVQIYPLTLAQAIDTETVEIKESLEGLEGLLSESSQVNLKSDQDSAGIVKTNNSIIDIPKNPDEAVSLKTGDTEINITLPELDKPQEGEIIAKGVVAYASESDFSNTVQANNDGSVRMTTIIDNPNAPTEYEYKVDLPTGGKIELQSDGSAVLYNNKQEPISIIAKPWAKDANGKEVKTWFSTDGLTLIQHVEHNVPDIVYPVVADPTWSEIQYCALPWNTNACRLGSGSIRKEAENIALSVYRQYGWSLSNGGADAVRHCYWSGRMVQVIGAKHAYEIGTRHESGSSVIYRNMDLHNNAVGRVIGAWTNSTSFLRERCVSGVQSKLLIWY